MKQFHLPSVRKPSWGRSLSFAVLREQQIDGQAVFLEHSDDTKEEGGRRDER